jgi:hypothetical protein
MFSMFLCGFILLKNSLLQKKFNGSGVENLILRFQIISTNSNRYSLNLTKRK